MTGPMKLFAYVLIIVGVSLGSIGAATTYMAPLTLDDETLSSLELSADAGADKNNEPLYPPGTRLTPEIAKALRDAGVTYVSISSFSLKTWDTRFLGAFVLACIMLVAGGAILRVETKKRVEKADASEATVRPEHTIAALLAAIDSLQAELSSLPTEPQRLLAILTRLDDAQRTHVADFIDARERLIGRHGLGRFAMIMDRFAASERAINRAWSAAADDHLPEAEASLAVATERLTETADALGAS